MPRFRKILILIQELWDFGHFFSNEQVQVIFCSLKVNITHNENVITSNDFSISLKLEDKVLRLLNPQEKFSNIKYFRIRVFILQAV